MPGSEAEITANTFVKAFSKIITGEIAIYLAIVVFAFTALVALIDIQSRSKSTTIKSNFNISCLIYGGIFWSDNYFASIFALVPFT